MLFESDDFMFDDQSMSLYEAKERGTFQVTFIPKIKLLENMGLRAGTQITIQNRYALGGPVLLRVEEAYDLALGKDIARQIAVRESGVL